MKKKILGVVIGLCVAAALIINVKLMERSNLLTAGLLANIGLVEASSGSIIKERGSQSCTDCGTGVDPNGNPYTKIECKCPGIFGPKDCTVIPCN